MIKDDALSDHRRRGWSGPVRFPISCSLPRARRGADVWPLIKPARMGTEPNTGEIQIGTPRAPPSEPGELGNSGAHGPKSTGHIPRHRAITKQKIQ